ncbi:hypothetical protein QYE76_060122 [Lolium multiflorum]|uniref:F-box domain-containing protein n=1 Tax=Lolium multiflorum TaxID=4521 RepID=A0AAD8W679_LOLMU|nr:hypothetical protein QYE76_060122 [Lolium multiflorum]
MAGGGDRLSELSDDLLRHIHHFAPVRKAASTAALSRRWRTLLWLRVNHLEDITVYNKARRIPPSGAPRGSRSALDERQDRGGDYREPSPLLPRAQCHPNQPHR